MELKCGKKTFTVTDKDRVFFNGACYMLDTQTVYEQWAYVHPIIAKTTAEKLIKSGDLILVSEKLEYVSPSGFEGWRRYYRFKEGV